MESPRLAPARGIRGGHHAVQLHGDRGQPRRRARDAREHRALEALRHPDARCVPYLPALQGSRPPRRRHQFCAGRRPGVREARPVPDRSRRSELHRLDRHLPVDLEDRRREPRDIQELPEIGRRDRRKGLRLRPPVGGSRGAREGARERLLRVSGPEVLGGLAGLRPEEPLGEAARAPGGRREGYSDRRRPGLPLLHERGHRRALLQENHGLRGHRADRARGEGAHRRQGRRERRLLRGAYCSRDQRSQVPDDGRGDLRTGAHPLRLRRRATRRDPRALRLDFALRAHRRGDRPGSGRHRAPGGTASPRGRKFLRQRQAYGRRRRPAALRGGPGLRHKRQGGQPPQPLPVAISALDQGNSRSTY